MKNSPKASGIILSAILSLLYFFGGLLPAYGQDPEYGYPYLFDETFQFPAGVHVHSTADRIFISDATNNRVYHTLASSLETDPVWEEFGYVADGTQATALNQPQDLTVDAAGNVYVIDVKSQQVKLYTNTSGSFTLDNRFTADTRTRVASIDILFPRDIEIGPGGRIYLLDSGNGRILMADGPADRSWEVWRNVESLGNPYGFCFDATGNVYIADTDHHRILKIAADGTEESIGTYGLRNGQFRFPRDVAVTPSGRLIIADTYNHRVSILSSDYRPLRNIGGPDFFGKVEKIHLANDHQLFITDSDNRRLIAFLGPAAAPPFDAYIRDNITDNGSAPTPEDQELLSPDILIRNRPDVEIGTLGSSDFESITSQDLHFDQNNYLYVAIRNRGTRPFPESSLAFYWSEPGDLEDFPEDWSTNGFYEEYFDGSGRDNYRLAVPTIAAQTTAADGTISDGLVIVGPIIFRPPSPADISGDSEEIVLMSRMVSVYDLSTTASGLEMVRLNNNIATRPAFVSVPDRYEPNDRLEDAVTVEELWEYTPHRCSDVIRRALGDPDATCPGIFENGIAPRGSQEIWTLHIPNLNLDAAADQDFYRINLVNPGDPLYGNHDIRPSVAPWRGTEPVPLPDCDFVQREDIGPVGRDRDVYISISGILNIEVVPITDEGGLSPVNLTDEQMNVYIDGALDETISRRIDARSIQISCPHTSHSLDHIVLSFGERESERPLSAAGAYELRLTYTIDIDRGIPDWAREENEGLARLGCGRSSGPVIGGGIGPNFSIPGISFGNSFPFCLDFDIGNYVGGLLHPGHLLTPDCIADGPGCFDWQYFDWPAGQPFLDVVFSSPVNLNVELYNEQQQLIGQAIALPPSFEQNAPFDFFGANSFQSIPSEYNYLSILSDSLPRKRLKVDGLEEGRYYMKITGSPTTYAMELYPQNLPDTPPGGFVDFPSFEEYPTSVEQDLNEIYVSIRSFKRKFLWLKSIGTKVKVRTKKKYRSWWTLGLCTYRKKVKADHINIANRYFTYQEGDAKKAVQVKAASQERTCENQSVCTLKYKVSGKGKEILFPLDNGSRREDQQLPLNRVLSNSQISLSGNSIAIKSTADD